MAASYHTVWYEIYPSSNRNKFNIPILKQKFWKKDNSFKIQKNRLLTEALPAWVWLKKEGRFEAIPFLWSVSNAMIISYLRNYNVNMAIVECIKIHIILKLFFWFPANGWSNPEVFVSHMLPKGESSLKVSAY